MNDKKDGKKELKPPIWGDDPFELKDAVLGGDSPSLKSELDLLKRKEEKKQKREKEKKMKVGLPRPLTGNTTDEKKTTTTGKTKGMVEIKVEKRSDAHAEITLRSVDCSGGKALRDLMSLVLKDVTGAYFNVSDSGPIREVKITVPSEEEKKKKPDYSNYHCPPGSGGVI